MDQNLQNLFNKFISEQRYCGNIAKDTVRNYKTAFDIFCKLMPSATLETLNPDTVRAFFEKLGTRKRYVGSHNSIEKSGVRPATIATYRGKLGAFFAWLRRNKHLDSDPFDGIKYPEIRYETREYLNKGEINDIFNAIGFLTC